MGERDLSLAEASEIVGDDIGYWLNNPFLTPDMVADKVRWWITTAAHTAAPESTPTEREAGDVGEVAADLVGLIASAMSNPTLPPETAIYPWGEAAQRVAAALAPLIAEREAEAWDACCARYFAPEPDIENPYRAAEKPGAGL